MPQSAVPSQNSLRTVCFRERRAPLKALVLVVAIVVVVVVSCYFVSSVSLFSALIQLIRFSSTKLQAALLVE